MLVRKQLQQVEEVTLWVKRSLCQDEVMSSISQNSRGHRNAEPGAHTCNSGTGEMGFVGQAI
jgi:hypothetical protein